MLAKLALSSTIKAIPIRNENRFQVQHRVKLEYTYLGVATEDKLSLLFLLGLSWLSDWSVLTWSPTWLEFSMLLRGDCILRSKLSTTKYCEVYRSSDRSEEVGRRRVDSSFKMWQNSLYTPFSILYNCSSSAQENGMVIFLNQIQVCYNVYLASLCHATIMISWIQHTPTELYVPTQTTIYKLLSRQYRNLRAKHVLYNYGNKKHFR